MAAIDIDSLRQSALPILAELGLALYDVEVTGTGRSRIVRVTIQNLGGGNEGIGIDQITDATRALDAPIDELIEGAFLLEVSSPGLERTLRRPEHFATAIGATISVKYRDDANTVQRARVVLTGHSETAITVRQPDGSVATIPLESITAAHTVFEWGPAPRPGKGNSPAAAKRTKETTRS